MYVPEQWTPPAPEIRTLHGLVRRYHSLVEMRTEEQNRLGAPIVAAPVKASITATLEHLERELERVDREIAQLFDKHPPLRRQRDLLVSIPGIGETTAARISCKSGRAFDPSYATLDKDTVSKRLTWPLVHECLGLPQ